MTHATPPKFPLEAAPWWWVVWWWWWLLLWWERVWSRWSRCRPTHGESPHTNRSHTACSGGDTSSSHAWTSSTVSGTVRTPPNSHPEPFWMVCPEYWLYSLPSRDYLDHFCSDRLGQLCLFECFCNLRQNASNLNSKKKKQKYSPTSISTF